MFISTLYIIPWIIFNFKHPDVRFIGLNQTKKSLLKLLTFEIALWLLLFFCLGKPNPEIGGQGSFAWTYMYIYEKGILPCFGIAELIDPHLDDRIDSNYQFFYLLTALLMDYILLKLISPQTVRLLRRTKK